MHLIETIADHLHSRAHSITSSARIKNDSGMRGAERLGGPQIHDQLKFPRLLNGEDQQAWRP
jgi:hypothetical protein